MSNPPASVGALLSLSPGKGQAYFLVLRFLSFFRLSFYVAQKVRLIWLLCSSEESLSAVQVATELPRQEVTRGDRLAPKPFAPGHQHNNPIPASPVSRNRMTMSFEVILDAVFWDVKFWRRAGNVSEEGRCSSETEQTLFVRTECSVCQEASHQQTEVEHNNPIFASLGNPSRGCSDSISRFLYDLGSKEVV